jgi:hypothetical protein
VVDCGANNEEQKQHQRKKEQTNKQKTKKKKKALSSLFSVSARRLTLLLFLCFVDGCVADKKKTNMQIMKDTNRTANTYVRHHYSQLQNKNNKQCRSYEQKTLGNFLEKFVL